VERATAAWVHWYRTSRLMHRLGRRPPAEADYYAQQDLDRQIADAGSGLNPGTNGLYRPVINNRLTVGAFDSGGLPERPTSTVR
jgi:hypothetical protein